MARLPTVTHPLSNPPPKKKTHFSGQGVQDALPLNCENHHKREASIERDPQIHPSSPGLLHPPAVSTRHTRESKGAQPHPRNPAQYPGIMGGPLCTPSLPPARANSAQIHLAGPIVKGSAAQEKQSNKPNFNLL